MDHRDHEADEIADLVKLVAARVSAQRLAESVRLDDEMEERTCPKICTFAPTDNASMDASNSEERIFEFHLDNSEKISPEMPDGNGNPIETEEKTVVQENIDPAISNSSSLLQISQDAPVSNPVKEGESSRVEVDDDGASDSFQSYFESVESEQSWLPEREELLNSMIMEKEKEESSEITKDVGHFVASEHAYSCHPEGICVDSLENEKEDQPGANEAGDFVDPGGICVDSLEKEKEDPPVANDAGDFVNPEGIVDSSASTERIFQLHLTNQSFPVEQEDENSNKPEREPKECVVLVENVMQTVSASSSQVSKESANSLLKGSGSSCDEIDEFAPESFHYPSNETVESESACPWLPERVESLTKMILEKEKREEAQAAAATIAKNAGDFVDPGGICVDSLENEKEDQPVANEAGDFVNPGGICMDSLEKEKEDPPGAKDAGDFVNPEGICVDSSASTEQIFQLHLTNQSFPVEQDDENSNKPEHEPKECVVLEENVMQTFSASSSQVSKISANSLLKGSGSSCDEIDEYAPESFHYPSNETVESESACPWLPERVESLTKMILEKEKREEAQAAAATVAKNAGDFVDPGFICVDSLEKEKEDPPVAKDAGDFVNPEGICVDSSASTEQIFQLHLTNQSFPVEQNDGNSNKPEHEPKECVVLVENVMQTFSASSSQVSKESANSLLKGSGSSCDEIDEYTPESYNYPSNETVESESACPWLPERLESLTKMILEKEKREEAQAAAATIAKSAGDFVDPGGICVDSLEKEKEDPPVAKDAGDFVNPEGICVDSSASTERIFQLHLASHSFPAEQEDENLNKPEHEPKECVVLVENVTQTVSASSSQVSKESARSLLKGGGSSRDEIDEYAPESYHYPSRETVESESDCPWLPERVESLTKVILEKEKREEARAAAATIAKNAGDFISSPGSAGKVSVVEKKSSRTTSSRRETHDDDKIECNCAKMCTIM